MFLALASILGPNQTLDFSVTVGADGNMKVIVKPQLAKGSNIALAVPLALVATPQELDAEFVSTLMQYASERTSLQQQVEVTTTIIAQAKASEVGKATKAIKAGPKQPNTTGDDSASDADDNHGDDDAGGANGILDDAPASTTAAPAPTPQKPAAPAPAANTNDDLLSLI